MITFKKSAYSKEELSTLLSIAISCVNEFTENHCRMPIIQCPYCKYKHICEDMNNLISYLGKITGSEIPVDNSVENVDNSIFDKNLSI